MNIKLRVFDNKYYPSQLSNKLAFLIGKNKQYSFAYLHENIFKVNFGDKEIEWITDLKSSIWYSSFKNIEVFPILIIYSTHSLLMDL